MDHIEKRLPRREERINWGASTGHDNHQYEREQEQHLKGRCKEFILTVSECVAATRGTTQNSSCPKLDVIRVIDGHNVSVPKTDTSVPKSFPCPLQAKEGFALVRKLVRNPKDKGCIRKIM